MKIFVLAIIGVGSVVALGAFSSANAQKPEDILPEGYTTDSFQSDWVGPGHSREGACAGMVRAKYGNRKYAITSTDESHRYRVPEFRIDSQYQYRCTVLLAPA